MATVGQQLLQPEQGWKRYDEQVPMIVYEGDLTQSTGVTNNYGGTNTAFRHGAKMTFSFTGNMLRLIGILSDTRSTRVLITIDGVQEVFSSNNGTSAVFQALMYEKTGLSSSRHEVEIINDDPDMNGNGTPRWFNIDAIDIGENRRIFHPNEVTDPISLSVGKRIRCHYTAFSGKFGYFSGLGEESSDFIPPTSSNVPNGDFYFIVVENWNGKKTLIADRAVQHSISWNELNTAGVASGNSIGISSDETNQVPLMTSATSPSGRVESSGQHSTFPAWMAFSRDVVDNHWLVSANTGWISYEFDEPTVIDSYSMAFGRQASYLPRMPKRWQFEGWNESSNRWDVLDINSVMTSNEWLLFENKYFYFNNKIPYKKYRLNVLENHGHDQLRVFNLQFHKKEDVLFRLPTGGVSSTDKDNEWDKYVVGSDLGGTITPGDNSVWNWDIASGGATWTSTSTSLSTTSRVYRGYNRNINQWSYSITTNSTAMYTFRPVLVVTSDTSPIMFAGGLTDDSVELGDSSLEGVISHLEGKKVRYSISLNDEELYPMSSLQNTPVEVSHLINDYLLRVGYNEVVVTIEDEDGESVRHTYSLTKIAAYRYLIKVGSEYKVFRDGSWVTVGTVPNDILFIQEGMTGLGGLTQLYVGFTANSDYLKDLNEGKVYRLTVDGTKFPIEKIAKL